LIVNSNHRRVVRLAVVVLVFLVLREVQVKLALPLPSRMPRSATPAPDRLLALAKQPHLPNRQLALSRLALKLLFWAAAPCLWAAVIF
jgi:hypothetical protein